MRCPVDDYENPIGEMPELPNEVISELQFGHYSQVMSDQNEYAGRFLNGYMFQGDF